MHIIFKGKRTSVLITLSKIITCCCLGSKGGASQVGLNLSWVYDILFLCIYNSVLHRHCSPAYGLLNHTVLWFICHSAWSQPGFSASMAWHSLSAYLSPDLQHSHYFWPQQTFLCIFWVLLTRRTLRRRVPCASYPEVMGTTLGRHNTHSFLLCHPWAPMGWWGTAQGGLASSWVGWVPATETALLGPSAASLSHTVVKERGPEHTGGQNVYFIPVRIEDEGVLMEFCWCLCPKLCILVPWLLFFFSLPYIGKRKKNSIRYIHLISKYLSREREIVFSHFCHSQKQLWNEREKHCAGLSAMIFQEQTMMLILKYM